MPLLPRISSFLRNLAGRDAGDRDMDQELESYVQLLTDEKIQSGASAAEASRQARLELGGKESVKESIRERRIGQAVQTFLQDLRYGGRMLRRYPGFTVAAVLTLALGIGANATIFSVVDGVLLRPLPYPAFDQLTLVWTTIAEKGVHRMVGSPWDVDDWRTGNRSFQDITAFSQRSAKLSGSPPEMVGETRVLPGFFHVIGIPPFQGRGFREEEREPANNRVAVISHDFWQGRLGGDIEALGSTIVLDGRTLEIIGVMPQDFSLGSKTEVWTPLQRSPVVESRASYWLVPIGRLKPGVSMEQAQEDLNGIMTGLAEIHPENKGLGVFLEPLLEVAVGSVRSRLFILWGTVGFVLLIACANVAHMLLSRITHRRQEIAVRTALGAARTRIVRQLLTEGALLSLLGGGVAVLLAALAIDILPRVAANTLPRLSDVRLDTRVMLFTLGLSLATSLFFGTLPALRATRRHLIGPLKESGNQLATGHRRQWRGLIVVGEVAVALVVLVGAALLLRSFDALTRTQPGFAAENLLTMRVAPFKETRFDGDEEAYFAALQTEREKMLGFYTDLMRQLQSLPGVQQATFINKRPLTGSGWGVRVVLEDQPPMESTELPSAQSRAIIPGFFQTMGIPLVRGRDFSTGDHSTAIPVAIISDSMARQLWPGQDPIGQRIQFRGELWHTVVGVAGDVRLLSLETRPGNVVYTNFAQTVYGFWDDWGVDLILRTEVEPMTLAGSTKAVVQAVDPDLPATGISSMSDALRSSAATRRFTTLLLGVFGLLSLSLAAIGVYGVLSYTVARQTHEFGIRLALGAERRDIIRRVLGRGMLLTVIGLGLGLGAALLLVRLMTSLLYGIGPTDITSFALATIILGGVAFLACYVPARRATRVDPVTALRHN